MSQRPSARGRRLAATASRAAGRAVPAGRRRAAGARSRPSRSRRAQRRRRAWGARPPLAVATSPAAGGRLGAQPPLTVATSPVAAAGGWGAPPLAVATSPTAAAGGGAPAPRASCEPPRREDERRRQQGRLIGKGGATLGIRTRRRARQHPERAGPVPARLRPTRRSPCADHHPRSDGRGRRGRARRRIHPERGRGVLKAGVAAGRRPGGLANCGGRHPCAPAAAAAAWATTRPSRRSTARTSVGTGRTARCCCPSRTGAAPPMKVAPPWNPHGLGRACSKPRSLLTTSRSHYRQGRPDTRASGVGVHVKIPSEADAGDPSQRTITITSRPTRPSPRPRAN